jgi:hypothetical protein
MAVNMQAHTSIGRRLLPVVLNERANDDPNQPFALIPVTGDLSKGHRTVTFANLRQAVSGFAADFKQQHGLSTNFETICYIGEPDLRTTVIFLALVTCGYKVRIDTIQENRH